MQFTTISALLAVLGLAAVAPAQKISGTVQCGKLQFVDPARDVLDAVLQDLFGDLFLIKDDNSLERAYPAPQISAHGDDLANHHGRA